MGEEWHEDIQHLEEDLPLDRLEQAGDWIPCLTKNCYCTLEKAPRCCSDGWQIIFTGSKKCSGVESRYTPIEGEAFGVAWSIEKARMFTLGCLDLLVT